MKSFDLGENFVNGFAWKFCKRIYAKKFLNKVQVLCFALNILAICIFLRNGVFLMSSCNLLLHTSATPLTRSILACVTRYLSTTAQRTTVSSRLFPQHSVGRGRACAMVPYCHRGKAGVSL